MCLVLDGRGSGRVPRLVLGLVEQGVLPCQLHGLDDGLLPGLLFQQLPPEPLPVCGNLRQEIW